MEPMNWCSTFIDASQDMICVLDNDAKTIYINPRFLEILGRSPDDKHEFSIRSILVEGTSDFDMAFRNALEKNHSTYVKLAVQNSDGSNIWIAGHLFPWVEDSNVHGVFCCFHDYSEYHAQQEAIVHRRNETQRLVKLLKHDTLSIYQGIVSAVELAIAEKDLTVDMHDILTETLSEVHRALKIVDHISQMIVLLHSELRPKPVIIDPILRHAIESVQKQYGDYQITFEVPQLIDYSVLGIDSLETVFSAIFSAAVELGSRRVTTDYTTFAVGPTNFLQIVFEIHGGVIPDKEKGHLFNEPAIGLNRSLGRMLSLAKMIVNRVGGALEVEDITQGDSKGTKFKVNLQLVEKQADNEGVY